MGKHKIMLLQGEIDLYNVPELRSAFRHFIDRDSVLSLIVDLQNVTHLDSAGMGALVLAQKKILAAKGNFFLAHINNDLHEVFEKSDMINYFKIYESKKNKENEASN